MIRKALFFLTAMFVFAQSADARSLFGCDFADCSSTMPSIGEGGTYGTGGGSTGTGGTGQTGQYSDWYTMRYDYGYETFIDPKFETKPGKPAQWERTCSMYGTLCTTERVNIIGKRDLVIWTYQLDPYSLFRGASSQYGTRFGDAATMAPPLNNDQERCIKNCDLIQKIESNTCNLHAAGIKVGGYAVGTLSGIAVIPVATTAAGATGPAAPAIGVAAGVGAGKVIIDASKDFAVAWNELCQALAGQRQSDCYTGTCKFKP
jgi:hypothetical protein